MSQAKKKLSVTINPDTYDYLEKFAERQGITRSAAAERILHGTLVQIVSQDDIPADVSSVISTNKAPAKNDKE